MPAIHKFLSLVALLSAAATSAPQHHQAMAKPVTAEPFAIAANPLAARAGLNVLRRGGSAVDAAIAIQAMLSLVGPQSTSVAGASFMTYFDAHTGQIVVYDGCEVAHSQAYSNMF